MLIPVTLYTVLLICCALFLLAFFGILFKSANILIVLMGIEMMLLSVNLGFLVFAHFFDDIVGQLFSLIILCVAAAESAIGLALMVIFYRLRGTLHMESFLLKH